MRYVKMEYPNGSVHNTLIREYNHSIDKDVDYIIYHDMTSNKELYAILRTIDGKTYKDSNILDYTYDDLANNKTEKNMNELPELIENLKENIHDNKKVELNFEVYKTDTGYYIASSIAEAFHLNKKYRNKKINNVICVPVSEDDIKKIEIISSQVIPTLKRKIVNELEYQTQRNFKVYHLVEANKYFINSKLCEEYGVGNGTHFINGLLCKEVTYKDIKDIEDKTKESNICLKATFKELEFKKELIDVYKSDNTNKYYIKEEICKKYKIGTTNHYIDNILYREVSESDLKKLQRKNLEVNYINLQLQAVVQKFKVYVDSNKYFIEDQVGKILGIGKGIHYIGEKLCRQVTLQEIKKIEESSEYGEIKYEPEYIYLTFKNKNEKNIIEEETIIYKDKNNNNKLFATKEDCNKYNIGDFNSFRYINNVECYEISLTELTKTKNPKVKTVYLQKIISFETINKKKKEFLVCKYDDYNFINIEIAKLYNIDYKTIINVDGQEYVNVDENNIEEIEKLSGMTKNIVNIKPVETNKNDINKMLNDTIDDQTINNNPKRK